MTAGAVNRVEIAFRAWRGGRTGGSPWSSSGDPSSSSRTVAAVIPFLVAGDPSLEATAAVVEALDSAGARLIEIGIPFSDPIADGPVISEAMRRAIERGTTPKQVFSMVSNLRSRVDAAIVFMVSISIIERIGRHSFVRQAAEAGADGLIVPDLDFEESSALQEICRSHGLVLPLLVAPATGPARRAAIASASSGFIYLLARAGVTGATAGVSSSDELAARVQALRECTSLPIACGFGISSREQVRTVTASADAAIVGSAFVRAIESARSPLEAARLAAALHRSLSDPA